MAVDRVTIRLLDRHGQDQGSFTIFVLPKPKNSPQPVDPLLDLRENPVRNPALEPLQLLEQTEYGYVYESDLPGRLATDPDEIFAPDNDQRRSGRLRPGLHTGTLPITLWRDGQEIGRIAFEVRSLKLDYLHHYRWMVRDVAESAAEVIMSRFAPTQQRFGLDPDRDAVTAYQRFAFLQSLITGEAFEAAIHQILARPHRMWVAEEEWRPVGGALPASSRVVRRIAGPGPRVDWTGGRFSSLPARLPVERSEETMDTPENRFVKFVLTRWRQLVAELGDCLAAARATSPVERGRRETGALLDRLDELLASDLFREVGRLTQIPLGSQVLQKRPGYRDILRAYAQVEAAATLAWSGGEDVYGAGQRDVATLYEYWVSLQLAAVIGQLCGQTFDFSTLLDGGPDGGVDMALRRGRDRLLLEGHTTRHGRRLRLELWFNKTFSPRSTGRDAWTRAMRPDCSLHIAVEGDGHQTFEPVWVHFDAKYRVDDVAGLFGARPATDDEEARDLDGERAEGGVGPKRADLLKMHAYRDAIRRSAGAYVLYPGTESERCKEYHELLPGLGAFALRPAEAGEAEGTDALCRFVDEVLDHVASQGSQHERGRFWLREVQRPEYRVDGLVPAASFLQRPPGDTLVLLGYVRHESQRAWIHYHKLYNMRADGRGMVGLGAKELAAELVLLWGKGGGLELWEVAGDSLLHTSSRMKAMGYENPSAEVYFCLPLKELPGIAVPNITPGRIIDLRGQAKKNVKPGEPVAVTWLDLVRPAPPRRS